MVTLTSRRIQTMEARDIFQSEVAALALGMRTALQQIPIENRKRVLILTDSNSALSFYTSKNLGHPHYKVMQSLVQGIQYDDDDHDESGEYRQFVKLAKVKSAKKETDGFFDHDVTDILSSFVKKVSNKDMEKLYSCQKQNHCIIDQSKLMNTDQLSVSINHSPGLSLCVECSRLKEEDLKYLEYSMDDNESKGNKKRQVLMKRESGERLRRCKERIHSEIGIHLETEI
mmetsp:Transcript_5522/g.6778  ORF Transcript_5522/g.6778 Transcript_5522/m.6778 type:complete len:229 (-) Transcript_5522:54-740(-)